VILLGALGLVAVATVIGLFVLWPPSAKVTEVQATTAYAVPGATFESGVITRLTDGCGGTDPMQASNANVVDACQSADVTILTGPRSGASTEVHLAGPAAVSGIAVGDRIQIFVLPTPGAAGGTSIDSFFGVDRSQSLLLFAIAFVVIVGLVAWLRGLLAILGLAFAGFMITVFVLPAALAGEPGLPIALVAASTIMFVVLYLAHGPSIRTSTALAGTICGIAITAIVAQIAVSATRLSGFTDESTSVLSGLTNDLDFRGLLMCGIIFAGLGVLNDVTITQSSAVWELRAAGPGLTRWQLFWSSMRIGRDHIASTIYTIVFAYVGTSLSVLLLLYLHDLALLQLLTFEDLAAEIVMTLCSAIGLVLAVPITTAIAVLLAAPPSVGDAGLATTEPVEPVPAEPRRPRTRQAAPENEMLRPLDWDF